MTATIPHQEWTRGDYTISTDPARLDVDVIHNFLRTSYWTGPHLPRDVVERSIANSLTFGVYHTRRTELPSPLGEGPGEGSTQVGFARVITDYSTFAYLADVFILEGHRGHGLGIWLMECIAAHPRLQNLRRWMLGTRDAHTLYEKSGWTRIGPEDGRWMEKADPTVYERLAKEARG
jgi:GNAT superfamily N-acetyltransferase